MPQASAAVALAYLATENPKSSGTSIEKTASISVSTTSVEPVTWS